MTETTYTFDNATVSDLHKDAFGFRPIHSFFQWWNCASDEEKQAEWDSLLKSLEATIAREEEQERVCITRFEAAVARTLSSGARDRATAIQWLKDAEGEMYVQDEQYFEWSMGIPYGYIKRNA